MKKSYLYAFLITLAIGAWIFSGYVMRSSTRASAPGGDGELAQAEVQLTAVRGRVLHARRHTAEIVLRGRTEALRSVKLRAETDGRVVELPVEKGAEVKTGDLVCRLAVDERAARLAEAEALVTQRELEYNASKELAAKGFRSETQTAGAKALLDAATAQVSQRQVELGYTRILAPFDGIIDDRAADIGDYLQKGHECAMIVDQDPYLVIGSVSERNVGAIEVGDLGRVSLLDGSEFEGKVRFIAKTANPLTRTFRLELEVANPERRLRDGLTADIRVAVRSTMAHQISPALLVLDDAGQVGVRIVDRSSIVRFVAITIVGDNPNGLWVVGLPTEVTIITVGQEFVGDGQKVELKLETGGRAS